MRVLTANHVQANKKIISPWSFIFAMVLVFLGLFVFLSDSSRVTGPLIIISSIIGIVVLSKAISKHSLTRTIISIYYLIITTVHFYFSVYFPDSIMGSYFNENYTEALFSDNNLLIKYWSLATIFLLIFVFVSILVEKKAYHFELVDEQVPSKLDIYGHRTWGSIFGKLALFALVSFGEIYLRQTNISFSFIGFFLDGLKLFLLISINVDLIKGKITVAKIFIVLIGIVLFTLPGAMLGRRVFVLRAFLSTMLFYVLIKKDEVIRFLKKRPLLIGITVIAILIIFGLITYNRFGYFNPLGALVSRITGLYDGCIAIKYIESNNTKLGFLNYLICCFSNEGIRTNYYYTYVVMGFPKDVSNGFANPFFTSALFYGIGGMIMITCGLALIFSIVACLAKRNAYLSKLENYSDKTKLALVFAFCDCLVFILYSFLIDGNVEYMRGFIPTFVALLFIFLHKLFFPRRVKKI